MLVALRRAAHLGRLTGPRSPVSDVIAGGWRRSLLDGRASIWNRPSDMRGAKLASIILAAGQGTRMKSDRAKVLHSLAGDLLVTYPLRLALDVGANPIVLVVGHQRDVVRERVEALFPGKVTFAEQIEQKGTGHAAMEGMKRLGAPSGRVLILYGDVPLLRAETIARLTKQMDSRGRPLSIVTTILDDPKGYGRIVRDARNRIERIVEERDATEDERRIREINAGIYCVDAKVLASTLGRLSSANAQGEYYLTDVVGFAIRDGLEVGWVLAEDSSEVLGVNTRAELAHLSAVLRRRTIERHMQGGVTILDPERTYIDERVRIGRDTVVHPGVHLRGDTQIGRDCVIDVGAVITDGRIGTGVEVRPYTVIEKSDIRAGAIVGPFSRLRPGAEIMDGAHVGNFVEIKNTKLGRGAKANHLAYLGDATIGDGSNIGAGTITCNYDGFGKHQTHIGTNVFVGSNATLVAPVSIKKDAYIAAGSTITESVGPNDLAFGRSRQVNKKGHAVQIRKHAASRAEQAKRSKAEATTSAAVKKNGTHRQSR